MMQIDEVLSDTKERYPIEDYNEFLKQCKMDFDRKFGAPSRSQFTIHHFDILKTIGAGSFSKVVVARAKEAGSIHAIKVMRKEKIVGLAASRYVIRERHILRAISFPFIIYVQTTFQDNSYLYIVMPFINGGDLFNLLSFHGQLSEKTAKFYIAQLTLCLEYLHYLGLVYRDLKPENVLLDSLGYVRLTDLGFCKLLEGRTYTFCGTPQYIAPEIIFGRGYGRGVDWWALGVMTYEMVAGRVPYLAADTVQLYELIATGGVLNVPPEFSHPLQNFVTRLLENDVSRRLGCLKGGTEEVKTHPWLSGVDWLALMDRVTEPPIVPKVEGPADTSNYEGFEDIELKIADQDRFSRQFADF